jgi:hypothetical protein
MRFYAAQKARRWTIKLLTQDIYRDQVPAHLLYLAE